VVPGKVKRTFMLEEAKPTPVIRKNEQTFKWLSTQGHN
jgi:hypothetical protein